MAKKIGIEPDLTPVKDFLIEKGYDVFDINNGVTSEISNSNFDAIVVTGLNNDFLGMEDTLIKSKVIDASGLTPPEVENKIKSI